MITRFIDDCIAKGINFALAGNGKLKISGNSKALSEELMAEIKLNKPQILRALKQEKLSILDSKFQNEVVKRGDLLARLDLTENEIIGIYPLVPLQESMLLHHIFAPEKDPYITYFSVKVSNNEKLDKIIEGFNFILARHASCRTQIIWQGVERSYQLVKKSSSVPVNYINCDNKLAVEEAVERLKSSSAPFNLETEPLLRITVVRDQGTNESILFIERHHIVSDHTSLEITLMELLRFIDGETNTLPEVNHQYQYALELNETGVPKADYFDHLLEGFEKPSLLFDLHTKQVDIEKFEYILRTLPSQLNEQIRKLSRELGVSPASFFHLAWAMVIGHHCDCKEVLFASVFSGRFTASEYRQTVGMFLNSLPFRIDMEGKGVVDSLNAVNLQLMKAYQYEQVPLEQSLQSLSQKFNNVFNSVLNYRHSAENDTISRLPFEILDTQDKSSIPFTMCISDTHTDFNLELKAYKNFYAENLVDDLISALAYITTSAIDNNQIDFKNTIFSNLKTVDSNVQLDNESSLGKSITSLFEDAANNYSDEIAAVYKEDSITYKELNHKATLLAGYIRTKYNTSAEQLVGLCVDRSIDMLVGIMGILKAGCAYVPLDPNYPSERLNYLIDDAALSLILTHDSYSGILNGYDGKVLKLDGVLEGSHEIMKDWQQNIKALDNNDIFPSHLAYVIYTSGSTGKPKGVMVEHNNVTRLLKTTECNFEFSQQDIWTMFHSFAFDFSVWEIFGALCRGSKLVIVPYEVSRSPKDFFRLLVDERVTVLNQTPSAFSVFINENITTSKALRLRYVIFGGEKLDFNSLRPWVDVCGDSSPKLVNMYGITETTVHVTFQQVSLDMVNENNNKSVIGKPLNDLTVEVRNKDGSETPINQPGELYVGGAGVTRGYLNRDKLTQERFIVEEESKSRLYRTGDIVKLLPDGTLEYLGRNDNQVKIRGFRIELGEIDATLKQLQGVDSAHVIANSIGSQAQLVAYIKREIGDKAEIDDENIKRERIRQELSQKLPEHMIPGFIIFVDCWPLTNNGKLDVTALPLPNDLLNNAHIDIAESAIENFIVDKIAEISNLNKEQVSVTQSLLNFGLNSILSLRLSQSISAEFDIANPLSIVLEADSIRELALEIDLLSSVNKQEEIIEDAIEEEW